LESQNSTIGGNGGGGIVEIPNLHGGQIDFNHVSVGTNLSIKLQSPIRIISFIATWTLATKPMMISPKINIIKADTAPKVVKISVWLISKGGK
jgi:hypothetical protein